MLFLGEYCSEVYIRASSKGQPFTIREVKASYIGQLVRISGIVTRCSDVKPLMQVAVYTCEECGFEIYQVIKDMPISDILSENIFYGNFLYSCKLCLFQYPSYYTLLIAKKS